MNIRGVAEALATFLSSDVADVREGRYHYGRTGTLQIFVVGNDYMTACKHGSKLPTPRICDYQFDWKKVSSNFFGWDIYEFSPNQEEEEIEIKTTGTGSNELQKAAYELLSVEQLFNAKQKFDHIFPESRWYVFFKDFVMGEGDILRRTANGYLHPVVNAVFHKWLENQDKQPIWAVVPEEANYVIFPKGENLVNFYEKMPQKTKKGKWQSVGGAEWSEMGSIYEFISYDFDRKDSVVDNLIKIVRHGAEYLNLSNADPYMMADSHHLINVLPEIIEIPKGAELYFMECFYKRNDAGVWFAFDKNKNQWDETKYDFTTDILPNVKWIREGVILKSKSYDQPKTEIKKLNMVVGLFSDIDLPPLPYEQFIAESSAIVFKIEYLIAHFGYMPEVDMFGILSELETSPLINQLNRHVQELNTMYSEWQIGNAELQEFKLGDQVVVVSETVSDEVFEIFMIQRTGFSVPCVYLKNEEKGITDFCGITLLSHANEEELKLKKRLRFSFDGVVA